MAKIKFFQQNSSLQACSRKPGSGESSSARQHNYRAIRGVNFSSSPAQHLFSPLQLSVKASNISFVPNNSHWLNYHQQEHCAAIQPAGIWEWCLKSILQKANTHFWPNPVLFLEKNCSPQGLLLGYPVQGQELGTMILLCHFQPGIFHDSVILKMPLPWPGKPDTVPILPPTLHRGWADPWGAGTGGPIPGSVQGTTGCDTQRSDLCDKAGIGHRLDSTISEISSNLNDSVTL